MEYADVVLAGILVVFSLAVATLGALGTTPAASVGVGSLTAAALVLHALFVNPPRG